MSRYEEDQQGRVALSAERARRLQLPVIVSALLHGSVVAAALWLGFEPSTPPVQKPLTVTLIPASVPAKTPEEPSPAPPSPAPPAPAQKAAEQPTRPRPTPTPRAVAAARPVPKPLPVVETAAEAEEDEPAPAPAPELTESQLAAATTAGSGSGLGSGAGAGGRACNMVQWLQNELRQNGDVRAALNRAQRGGRATMIWDGAWVRTQGEDGPGLAVVRQAVAVKVAFAPEACRRDPVRGLVLISLGDGPGAPRLALGDGAWAWSDLLH